MRIRSAKSRGGRPGGTVEPETQSPRANGHRAIPQAARGYTAVPPTHPAPAAPGGPPTWGGPAHAYGRRQPLPTYTKAPAFNIRGNLTRFPNIPPCSNGPTGFTSASARGGHATTHRAGDHMGRPYLINVILLTFVPNFGLLTTYRYVPLATYCPWSLRPSQRATLPKFDTVIPLPGVNVRTSCMSSV